MVLTDESMLRVASEYEILRWWMLSMTITTKRTCEDEGVVSCIQETGLEWDT